MYFAMTANDGSSDAGDMDTPRYSRLMVGPSTALLSALEDLDRSTHRLATFWNDYSPIRPTGTPPPSARSSLEDSINEPDTMDAHNLKCTGRRFVTDLPCRQSTVPTNCFISPASLNTNDAVRDMVFSSVPNSPPRERRKKNKNTPTGYGLGLLDEDDFDILSTDDYNLGSIQTPKSNTHAEACTTSPPPASTDEIMLFSNKPLPKLPSRRQHRSQIESGREPRPLSPIATIGQDEDATNSPSPQLTTVVKNVAITEQAAEFGTPDVSLVLDMQPVDSAHRKRDDKASKS